MVKSVCTDCKAKPTSPWMPGAQGCFGLCASTAWSALGIRDGGHLPAEGGIFKFRFFLHLRIFFESSLYLQKIQVFSDLFAWLPLQVCIVGAKKLICWNYIRILKFFCFHFRYYVYLLKSVQKYVFLKLYKTTVAFNSATISFLEHCIALLLSGLIWLFF